MVGTTAPAGNRRLEYVTAEELLSEGFIKLPYRAVEEIGSAAQAVAGVARLAGNTGETFARLELIADASRIPVRTLKRKLLTAVAGGYLKRGRSHRRTVTYTLMPKARQLWGCSTGEFGCLPLFAATEQLPWSARLVYAFLVARAQLETAVNAYCPLDLRVPFIEEKTRLSRASVFRALDVLNAVDLVYRHVEEGFVLTRSVVLGQQSQNGPVDTPQQSQNGPSGGLKMAFDAVSEWPSGGSQNGLRNYRESSNLEPLNEEPLKQNVAAADAAPTVWGVSRLVFQNPALCEQWFGRLVSAGELKDSDGYDFLSLCRQIRRRIKAGHARGVPIRDPVLLTQRIIQRYRWKETLTDMDDTAVDLYKREKACRAKGYPETDPDDPYSGADRSPKNLADVVREQVGVLVGRSA